MGNCVINFMLTKDLLFQNNSRIKWYLKLCRHIRRKPKCGQISCAHNPCFLIQGHILVLYLPCINDCSRICFCSTFKQRIAIHMCMRTRGRHRLVTEISKTANFRAYFFYNMFIILVSKPTHPYNFLYWQVFQAGERNQRSNQL